jgi:hypothetical protein
MQPQLITQTWYDEERESGDTRVGRYMISDELERSM